MNEESRLKRLATKAAWRKANPEKMRGYRLAWKQRNPDKHYAAQRKWLQKNPEKRRIYNDRRNEYNRTTGSALRRAWKTRGQPEPLRPRPDLCECCGSPPNGRGALHLDHCHQTGAFRGWLCSNCNLGIGSLGDSQEGLERALAYLKRA